MTTTTTPQLALTRIFDAPRALVYQAFTDPDHLAAWWGPLGNSLPRDEIEFDVRRGLARVVHQAGRHARRLSVVAARNA